MHSTSTLKPLFICTDLDRTLLPNGEHPESPGARERFSRLVSLPSVTLAYVSGRHLALIEQCIHDYALPIPDWVVADVGTSIYRNTPDGWRPHLAWTRHIAEDWNGHSGDDLGVLLETFGSLQSQPEDRQSAHKLSYFIPCEVDHPALLVALRHALDARGVSARLVHSIDEQASVGLLDVLPERASKLHAIEYLMHHLTFDASRTVFAGDSGNDLDVLTSSVPAVLVANAHPDVVQLAEDEACRTGTRDHLYLARGDFLGMNGCYSAGILEGIAHFHPEATLVLS